jgi:hypothetical protein
MVEIPWSPGTPVGQRADQVGRHRAAWIVLSGGRPA